MAECVCRDCICGNPKFTIEVGKNSPGVINSSKQFHAIDLLDKRWRIDNVPASTRILDRGDPLGIIFAAHKALLSYAFGVHVHQ